MGRLGVIAFVAGMILMGSRAQEKATRPIDAERKEKDIEAALTGLKQDDLKLDNKTGEYHVFLGKVSAPTGNERAVELQLGTYRERSAYINVVVPAGKEIETISQIDKLAPKALGVQSCAGQRACVKTCSDKSGKEYCCKYQCQ